MKSYNDVFKKLTIELNELIILSEEEDEDILTNSKNEKLIGYVSGWNDALKLIIMKINPDNAI